MTTSVEQLLQTITEPVLGKRLGLAVSISEANYIVTCMELAGKSHPSILNTYLYKELKEFANV